MKFPLFTLIGVAILFASCVTPPNESLFAFPPDGGLRNANAYIIISRPSNLQGSLVSVDLLIDGTEIAKVENGETRSLQITPGKHIIELKWGYIVAFRTIRFFKGSTCYIDLVLTSFDASFRIADTPMPPPAPKEATPSASTGVPTKAGD